MGRGGWIFGFTAIVRDGLLCGVLAPVRVLAAAVCALEAAAIGSAMLYFRKKNETGQPPYPGGF